MLAVSTAAVAFLIEEEDSSEAYYGKHYSHFDWPGQASGPTIGVGYDCGYVTVPEARADWQGIVPDDCLLVITRACGVKGEAAKAFVGTYRNAITVTWPQAVQEFKDREIPKWLTRMSAVLPNLDKLSPDSLGALLSLSYNRGCSYDLPGPRYAEMRAIRAFMAAGQYASIPAEILSMRRLWPQGSDLWGRRTREAALFEKGLPT